MIGIEGITTLLERLELAPWQEVQVAGLRKAALKIRGAVRARLGTLVGGPHQSPWLESGALQDSIRFVVGPERAVIGSADPAAVAQERGTRFDPPRPFLAPAAASVAPEAVSEVAYTVAAMLETAR